MKEISEEIDNENLELDTEVYDLKIYCQELTDQISILKHEYPLKRKMRLKEVQLRYDLKNAQTTIDEQQETIQRYEEERKLSTLHEVSLKHQQELQEKCKQYEDRLANMTKQRNECSEATAARWNEDLDKLRRVDLLLNQIKNGDNNIVRQLQAVGMNEQWKDIIEKAKLTEEKNMLMVAEHSERMLNLEMKKVTKELDVVKKEKVNAWKIKGELEGKIRHLEEQNKKIKKELGEEEISNLLKESKVDEQRLHKLQDDLKQRDEQIALIQQQNNVLQEYKSLVELNENQTNNQIQSKCIGENAQIWDKYYSKCLNLQQWKWVNMAQNGSLDNEQYKMDIDTLKQDLQKSIFGNYIDDIKGQIDKTKLLELCAGPGANIPLWFEFGFVLQNIYLNDISQLALNQAKQEYQQLKFNIIQSDLATMLPTNSQCLREMDVIIALGGLGLLDDEKIDSFLTNLNVYMADWTGDIFFIEAVHDREKEENLLFDGKGKWAVSQYGLRTRTSSWYSNKLQEHSIQIVELSQCFEHFWVKQPDCRRWAQSIWRIRMAKQTRQQQKNNMQEIKKALQLIKTEANKIEATNFDLFNETNIY